MPNKFCKLYCY